MKRKIDICYQCFHLFKAQLSEDGNMCVCRKAEGNEVLICAEDEWEDEEAPVNCPYILELLVLGQDDDK